MKKEALIGKGRYQWNTLGWFGALIGSTLWMLVPLLIDEKFIAASVTGIVLFLMINSLGLYFWVCRDKLEPFFAIQSILIMIFFATFLLVALFEILSDENIGIQIYSVVLMVAFMLGMFNLIEREAIKNKKSDKSNEV